MILYPMNPFRASFLANNWLNICKLAETAWKSLVEVSCLLSQLVKRGFSSSLLFRIGCQVAAQTSAGICHPLSPVTNITQPNDRQESDRLKITCTGQVSTNPIRLESENENQLRCPKPSVATTTCWLLHFRITSRRAPCNECIKCLNSTSVSLSEHRYFYTLTAAGS